MQKLHLMPVYCLLAFILGFAPSIAKADSFQAAAQVDTSVLEGIPKLACEAILCLSSSSRPGECSQSISHYFGINKKTWSSTVKARRNFLNQCPVMDAPGMPELREAILDGSGYCDAATLNKNTYLVYRTVSGNKYGPWTTQMPDCENYSSYRKCYESKRVIHNQIPSRCLNYFNNSFTDFESLRYEGDIYNGGMWVE